MSKWSQESTASPGSYKIQVHYVDIPKHIKLKTKKVDTPFRFNSYEDAEKVAAQMFDAYDFSIVASNDEPHWQLPTEKKRVKDINSVDWYTVHGVSIEEADWKKISAEKIENNKYQKELARLKPEANVHGNFLNTGDELNQRMQSMKQASKAAKAKAKKALKKPVRKGPPI